MTARVIGATSKPSLQMRSQSTRDPFKKLKDALDSATGRSQRSKHSSASSGPAAGLLGRDEAAAVGTSGRDAAGPTVPSDLPESPPGVEAGDTQSGNPTATQNTATPAERSLLRMAGIALVIVGLLLGLFAYSRRGTRT